MTLLNIKLLDGKVVIPEETALTQDTLRQIVNFHSRKLAPEYQRLKNLYTGDHDILKKPKKAQYKPDNRLVANFAKYLVDTFTGFFVGIPPRITHDSEDVSQYIAWFSAYSGIEDTLAEVAKDCDIYGVSPVLMYMDEDSMPCITKSTPLESFVVYDDSILHKPMFGIRYYKNGRNRLEGTVSDDRYVYSFVDTYRIADEWEHHFDGVPVVEFIQNAERISIISSVDTLINEYDKALSEKANDLDYYADAYLKILGKKLDTDTIKQLRDNRIINFSGNGADKLIVEFLQKPDSDNTSEHLLDRLERLIFALSMVANISEQNFGNASGTALAYRLQPMSNLAKAKERKFIGALQKCFKLLASVPTSRMAGDDWVDINFTFTQNIPKNLLEESQIVKNLQGIVSDETLLSLISAVKNVKAELEKINSPSVED